jgi:hypothetical protein
MRETRAFVQVEVQVRCENGLGVQPEIIKVASDWSIVEVVQIVALWCPSQPDCDVCSKAKGIYPC